MVHSNDYRKSANRREAAWRSWRTLLQGVAGVALVAGADAVISSGSTDLATVGKAFGAAALAAVLAYAMNLVKGERTDQAEGEGGTEF
ncbi:hypothetical protein [Streptosporangium sp. OZ121]|uniref:hypothetical protein n=1 Tax=Streptosporangium sp. OZ121 TaxID=3444183 RepID=UPI003F79D7C0